MKKLMHLFVLIFLVACQSNGIVLKTRNVKTLDTDFSKGRLGLEHSITLEDLEKFHGHMCDGLVVGYQALSEVFKLLYPNEPVDRTNTRIVSKSSPCLTDAAIYLTGGRYQFNTFYVFEGIQGLFVVQRIDTEKTVMVTMNQGVKPKEIDRLGSLAVKGELNSCQLDELKSMEDDFSEFLLKTNPAENFKVSELSDFQWKPVLKNDFIKTDILNKYSPLCDH